MTGRFEIIREQLPRVEAWAQTFETVEHGINPDQCIATREALRELQVSLTALTQTPKPDVFVLVPLYHALERVNDVLLLLAAYQPVCQIRKARQLRQQQTIARGLSQVTRAVQTLLATPSLPSPSTATRRERAGFWVVPRTGQ